MWGFLLGVALGVGLGMLVAPQSGKDTRQRVTSRLKDVREKTREAGEDIQQSARDIQGEAERRFGA
ncbi:MAG TPA: YtxH domain-containing protein [Dehalococcoidia bacterium]|nr:YtxH domain-containing protein [Dehalococcoidia bacterium]